MKKWSRLVFSLGFLAWLSITGTAQAQDPITNTSQFSAVFDQPGLSYPLALPFEGTFQPVDTWFVDFSTLTNAVAAMATKHAQKIIRWFSPSVRPAPLSAIIEWPPSVRYLAFTSKQ